MLQTKAKTHLGVPVVALPRQLVQQIVQPQRVAFGVEAGPVVAGEESIMFLIIRNIYIFFYILYLFLFYHLFRIEKEKIERPVVIAKKKKNDVIIIHYYNNKET